MCVGCLVWWGCVSVTAESHARSVLYVPNADYLGKDHFTYTVYVGVNPSERGTVTVHTRRCRLDCMNEQFDDRVLAIDQQC